jgi:hypothetical protein
MGSEHNEPLMFDSPEGEALRDLLGLPEGVEEFTVKGRTGKPIRVTAIYTMAEGTVSEGKVTDV